MDIWMLYQRKLELLQARLREQHLREQLEDGAAASRWHQRAALRCGPLLLRLGRRLIRYGTPLDRQTLPALRRIR